MGGCDKGIEGPERAAGSRNSLQALLANDTTCEIALLYSSRLTIQEIKMTSSGVGLKRISQSLDLPPPNRAAPIPFPNNSNQAHTGKTPMSVVVEPSNRSQRPSQVSNRSFQSAPVTFLPPSRSSSVVEPCDVCKAPGITTWTCIQCNNDSFCNDCWAKERAHRPGAVGFDGKPHEKTDRRVVERLRGILEPERTPEQQQELHRSDEDTTWFGIARDSANLPIFQDYERYASIMAQSRTSEVNVRYPQLVSFIGQTGWKPPNHLNPFSLSLARKANIFGIF